MRTLYLGKKRFASARKHQFTPLESIAIYTDDGDSTPIDQVFQKMLDQLEDNPPVPPGAKSDELHEYFADVLPNYDRDRVYTGDIKKVIKWFSFLNAQGFLTSSEEENKEEEE